MTISCKKSLPLRPTVLSSPCSKALNNRFRSRPLSSNYIRKETSSSSDKTNDPPSRSRRTDGKCSSQEVGQSPIGKAGTSHPATVSGTNSWSITLATQVFITWRKMPSSTCKWGSVSINLAKWMMLFLSDYTRFNKLFVKIKFKI